MCGAGAADCAISRERVLIVLITAAGIVLMLWIFAATAPCARRSRAARRVSGHGDRDLARPQRAPDAWSGW